MSSSELTATSEDRDLPSGDAIRVLYIGGCGRSGSTLLDRMLGQVDGLWSVGEIVHIWRRGLLGSHLCGCGRPFRGCPFWTGVGIAAFGGWDRIDVEEMLRLQRAVDRNRYIPFMLLPWLWPGYRHRLRRYAGYLARLYRGIAEVSGARTIVDSTKHASYAYLLRRVPGVRLRVVHLARDARGVAYSWTKEIRKPEVTEGVEYMPRYHPTRMAFRWLAYNALFHLLRWTGTPTMFLRYETLVTQPRHELERILSFEGMDHGREALAFIRNGEVELGPTHTVAGNPMRFAQGSLTPRVDQQWREQMDRRLQRIVGALTWPLMRAYGYRKERLR